MKRREFIRLTGLGILGLLFSGCAGSGDNTSTSGTDLNSSTAVSQDVSTDESIIQSSQDNSKADTAKDTPTDISTYPQFDFEKKTFSSTADMRCRF